MKFKKGNLVVYIPTYINDMWYISDSDLIPWVTYVVEGVINDRYLSVVIGTETVSSKVDNFISLSEYRNNIIDTVLNEI